MNLPNKLTLSRIGCTVLMVIFLLIDGPVFAWLSVLMFVAASLTDMADGHIARSRNLVTNLGKFMDPLADKILNYSVMVLLIPEGLIPPVALVIILFREFLVSGIRQVAVEQGKVIAANIWGKIKTLVQDVSLAAILLFRAVGVSFLAPMSLALIWLCAALTVISGVIYLAQNADVLRE
ncbi:MAG: CDP-diacylglycerol--glycerol-3-phosphate 3-phosphatidyltransferase [Oscillospiraceae bacterium]|nr:CDP-diacylglycerol--glycerol-3-phosphate 3-phosphatidyltransferase [Oscillospiraceae bacterium]